MLLNRLTQRPPEILRLFGIGAEKLFTNTNKGKNERNTKMS